VVCEKHRGSTSPEKTSGVFAAKWFPSPRLKEFLPASTFPGKCLEGRPGYKRSCICLHGHGFVVRGLRALPFRTSELHLTKHSRRSRRRSIQEVLFSPIRVEEVFRILDNHLESVDVIPIEEPACRGLSDDLILACAKAAHADCLTTGDEDLLILESFGSTRIIKQSGSWRFEKSQLE